ncbi:MAG: virulence protein E [Bacteroidales bacterium]|nr:virulence protein E [Bacteroidales bacterium]
MIMAGKKINDPFDALKKISIEYFYKSVKEPKSELANRINSIRKVKQLNPEKFSQLKKTLPYIVCGIFSPPFRKTENFSRIGYFILDIDHLSSKSINVNNLKSKLSEDERVHCIFISPGQDGLKIMFQLENLIYDPVKYKVFYRQFASKFALHYSIEQVVDTVTCDVSRACFISYDSEAFYRKDPVTIKADEYISFEDSGVLKSIQDENRETAKTVKAHKKDLNQQKDLDEEKMQEIKSLLGVRYRQSSPKQIFVPDQLEKIKSSVEKTFEEYNIVTDEISNINFGKKYKVHLGNKHAEVNLFYGKKGYVVVKSPRRGTNPELNDIVCNILGKMFYGAESE